MTSEHAPCVKIAAMTLEALIEAADKWSTELDDYVLPSAAEAGDEDAQGYRDEMARIDAAVAAARSRLRHEAADDHEIAPETADPRPDYAVDRGQLRIKRWTTPDGTVVADLSSGAARGVHLYRRCSDDQPDHARITDPLALAKALQAAHEALRHDDAEETPMTVDIDSAKGDGFVVVRGGLVTNDPALPVFDLDALESTDHDQRSAVELCELYDRICRHSRARDSLRADLVEIEAVVRAHGTEEDIEDLERIKVEIGTSQEDRA